MNPIVKYLKAVLEQKKSLSDYFFNAEETAHEKDSQILRVIFQQPELNSLLPAEALALFDQGSALLKAELEKFKPVIAEQTLLQADRLIDKLVGALFNERDWQELVATIHPHKKNAFIHDLRAAFIFRILSAVTNENRHLLKQIKFIELAAFSRNKKPAERLKMIARKVEPKVSPTVCYFLGKGDLLRGDLTHFGHVAVGLHMENDLVLSSKAPPLQGSIADIQKYTEELPVAADHNAYLVAGTGCRLALSHAENNDDLSIDQLKILSQNDTIPVLIKKDKDFYIYGRLKDEWQLIQLTGLSEEEKAALKKLPTDENGRLKNGILEDGDPLQWAIIELIKKGHTPNNIYYLDRTKSINCQLDRVADPERQAQQFMKRYITEQLSPGETSKSLAQNLPVSQLEEIEALLKEPATQFSTYLTYGRSKDTAQIDLAKVQNSRVYSSEIRTYGQHTLITLPPCERLLFEKATEQFANKDRKQYNVLTNNCAQAVGEFMKTTCYLSPSRSFTRPQACAAEAFRIVLKDIKEARVAILGSQDLSGLEKIRRLLENDLRRLEQQKELDRINHLSKVKAPAIKQVKIERLRALLKLANASEAVSPKLLDELISAHGDLGDKTATHLQQAIACFPFDKLAPEVIEAKKKFLLLFEASIQNYFNPDENRIFSFFRDKLATFKKLFPASRASESAIEDLSAKEIYFLFDKIFKNLSQESRQPAIDGNRELLKFYQAWYVKAQNSLYNLKAGPLPAPDGLSSAEVDLNLSTSTSFLTRSTDSLRNAGPSFPSSTTQPDTWYSLENSPHSQYQYIRTVDQNEHRTPTALTEMLLATLASPKEKTPLFATVILPHPPSLEKDEQRLSRHVLPGSIGAKNDLAKAPVKFGLLETCIKPGQEANSKLLLPPQHFSSSQLLRIADHQIQELCKLLRKKESTKPSLTLRTLELDKNLRSKRKLTALEKVFIQYCLAMNLDCRVIKDGKKITLDKKQLAALVPPFDAVKLQRKIVGSRTLPLSQPEDEETPAASLYRL